MAAAEPDFVPVLRRLGVLAPNEAFAGEPLGGGVSSDIWRVDTRTGPVCVKRALARLRVAADWRAPVERNAYEVAWFRAAGTIAPSAAPRIRAHDDAAGLFVMDYLEPSRFRLWKDDLRRGRVCVGDARAIGTRLAAIHAGSATDPALPARFASDALFHALRIEPYLEATAHAHGDLATAILAVAEETAATRHALVHGDVSPKNILLGETGPVFLDAECAWWGDPAFDLAFCLNHLLLKSVWVPAAAPALDAAFTALAAAYIAGADWDPRPDLERRAARLLPALLLARIDGKSPVEYITGDTDRARVRRTARRLLTAPADRLARVLTAWIEDRTS